MYTGLPGVGKDMDFLSHYQPFSDFIKTKQDIMSNHKHPTQCVPIKAKRD